MILKYSFKNNVNNKTLNDVIVSYIKEKNSDDEEKLFSMFYEITNIIRTYVTSKGYHNLNFEDWNDIIMVSIEHMFKKLDLYNEEKINTCFAFCYMILFNKMRDLIKASSFKKFIYHSSGNLADCDYKTNLSSNHNGTPNHINNVINPIPVKRFDFFDKD
jgi:hypothetical protein